jgi:hypothetical protein
MTHPLTGGHLRQALSHRIRSVDSPAWLVGATFAWILISAGLLAIDPLIALSAAAAPAVLYIVATRSWARVAIVVGGGLILLGSANEVGPQKVVYAAIFVFCAVISSIRLLLNSPTWFAPFKPMIPIGFVVLACLMLSTVANPGVDLTQTIRQGIFYVMIPFAPIIGLDAGRDAKARVVMRWIGVIGCVAAAGFAADWLNRRGVSSLPVGRFILSSLVVPALAFALAIVRAVYARGFARIAWLIPIVLIPAAMLVTGTRTNLIVFLALLGVLGTKAKRRVNLLGIVGLLVFVSAMIAFVLPIVADAVVSQPGFLEGRIQALQVVLDGNAGADQSYALRNDQYYYSAQWISESPWFGKGLGFLPPISLDTPLAIPVRVGIVGSAAVSLLLAAFMLACRKTARLHGYTFMHTAVTGIAIVVLANLPFGPVIEDRGFAFMLMLLSMGIGAYVQERVDGVPDFAIQRPAKAQVLKAPALAYAHLVRRAEALTAAGMATNGQVGPPRG